MKKIFPLLMTVVVIASLLAGCTTSTPTVTTDENPQASAPIKDTLTYMAVVNAESLNPASGKPGDHTAYRAIYDTLVNLDDNGNIRPGLAETWTKSDDGLTYTLNLRKDVKFHDGSQMTADDVIFTFDTIMALPLFGQFTLALAKWEKADDYTVKFTATQPYVSLLKTLALISMIMPKATYTADPAGFESKPIGTGPFKFVSRDADGTIHAEANDNYFGGKPAFAKAVIKPPVESSTAVVALENGEVDIIVAVPPAQIELIKKNAGLNLVETAAWTTNTLIMMGQRLRDDSNLRAAIFHGIDRQKMIDIASEGVGSVTNDVYNKKTLGSLAGKVNYTGYDEALAKEYLAESGYQLGSVIMMTVMTQDSAMAQSIQADLKKLGIEVEIEQLDVNGWSTKILNGEAEMTLVQFGGVGGGLENMLISFSNAYPYLGKDMYSTPEYEDLIVKIQAEPDPEKRQELMGQAIQLQYDFANTVSLFDVVNNFAHSKSITNIPAISAATQIFYLGNFEPAQ